MHEIMRKIIRSKGFWIVLSIVLVFVYMYWVYILLLFSPKRVDILSISSIGLGLFIIFALAYLLYYLRDNLGYIALLDWWHDIGRTFTLLMRILPFMLLALPLFISRSSELIVALFSALFAYFLGDFYRQEHRRREERVREGLHLLQQNNFKEFLEFLQSNYREDPLLLERILKYLPKEDQRLFISSVALLFLPEQTKKEQEGSRNHFGRHASWLELSRRLRFWVFQKKEKSDDREKSQNEDRYRTEKIHTMLFLRKIWYTLTPEQRIYIDQRSKSIWKLGITLFEKEFRGLICAYVYPDLPILYYAWGLSPRGKSEQTTTYDLVFRGVSTKIESSIPFYNLLKAPINSLEPMPQKEDWMKPIQIFYGEPGSGRTTWALHFSFLSTRFEWRYVFLPFYIPIYIRINSIDRAFSQMWHRLSYLVSTVLFFYEKSLRVSFPDEAVVWLPWLLPLLRYSTLYPRLHLRNIEGVVPVVQDINEHSWWKSWPVLQRILCDFLGLLQHMGFTNYYERKNVIPLRFHFFVDFQDMPDILLLRRFVYTLKNAGFYAALFLPTTKRLFESDSMISSFNISWGEKICESSMISLQICLVLMERLIFPRCPIIPPNLFICWLHKVSRTHECSGCIQAK